MIRVINVPNTWPRFSEAPANSARVVHVGKFLEAWSPVVEVVVVLVSVRAARRDGTEAACQGALSLEVVDQGCVVRRHIGVVVRRLQALTSEM